MDKEVVKKQNHKVTLFALFLSLVSIGVLVFGFLLVSSNKVILLQSVSNIYNKIDIFQKNDMNLLNKVAASKNNGINSNIVLKRDNTDILKIDFNYLESSDDNQTRLDLVINLLEDELVNSNIVLKDNKFYFFIKNITENYYYTDLSYQSIFKTLSSSDYSKILEYIKDAIDETIKNDDIKKDKVTVKYNDKDKKVNRLTYKIRNKELNNMIKYFTKLIKNDKSLYKNIASLLEISTDSFDKEMDNLSSLFSDDLEKEIFEYDVYYYGFNKIFRYELKHADSGLMFSYQENKDNYVINLGTEENNIVNMVVKSNKDAYDYELSVTNIFDGNKYTISGTYQKDNLVINYDDNKVDITTSSEEKEGNFINRSKILLREDDDNSVEIDINNTNYFDKKVEFNANNSKSIDEIESEELELLINNIKESKLYELLIPFTESLEMSNLGEMEFLGELK